MTSKLIFYNVNIPSYIPFRKDQVLINSWHGFPYKTIGKDGAIYDKSQFAEASYYLSDSKFYSDFVIRRVFDYSGKILHSGFPRNNIFYNKEKSERARAEIREKYGIKSDRVLLYAPTFRNTYQTYETNMDYSRLTRALEEKTGESWSVMVRLHPMVREAFTEGDSVINVTMHPDTHELMCAADCLISDCSSVMYDFMIQKRPVFSYVPDLSTCKIISYYDHYYKQPFKINETMDELISEIEKYDESTYISKVDAFFNEIDYCGEKDSIKMILDAAK